MLAAVMAVAKSAAVLLARRRHAMARALGAYQALIEPLER